MAEDRCVCCGEIIPEGMMVCPNCMTASKAKPRLIDASPDDCIKKTKCKTNFAKIVVSGTAEEPYYEIMWFNYLDRQYHIGYGSYNINFVFQWLAECFEVEDAPTVDAVEVVRCKDCMHWIHMEGGFGDCTNRRFHLDGHADPTMKMDDFCSCGERRTDEQ